MKCYVLSIVFHGAECRTLRKVDQEYFESSEIWCWRRMEKITWTDRVKNENVSHRVGEERNIPHTVNRRNSNWIGDILHSSCILKHFIDSMIEGRRRRGKRRKQLLKEKIVYLERGSTRSHCWESSVWKKLCACRKVLDE
jgi:hypothetical protein